MAMESLPDDLWRKIMEIGAKITKILSYRELCILSITSKRFHRLSGEDSIWSHLIASDFDSLDDPRTAPTRGAYKSVYRIRFEKARERKRAIHRRVILRKESQIAQHLLRIRHLEVQLSREVEKSKSTSDELANLYRVRQASAALNVWQPEVVIGRHKHLVAQCPVPIESRLNAVDMELKLCKEQISILRKSREDEKRRLDVAKKELDIIKYHPLREYETNKSESLAPVASRKRLKK